MGRVEAADIAATYSGEIKAYTESKTGSELPKLVAFLANDDKAAVMYARWTEKACTRDGIIYELRKVERVDLEASVIEANNDPTVHGILVYYPVFGGPIDDYLREVIELPAAIAAQYAESLVRRRRSSSPQLRPTLSQPEAPRAEVYGAEYAAGLNWLFGASG